MTMPGLLASARTLAYYTRRQEVTANNLANVETDGFKADRIVARLAADGMHPLPEQALDLTQGSLEQTGRPFDLALDGPGFFVVSTPEGERFTRGGTFTLDGEGFLTDGRGGQVMGEGGPIRISGKDVRVDAGGRITVDGIAAGTLRVETVADPRTLIERQRREYLQALRDLAGVAPNGNVAGSLLVEGAALHLEADLKWLDLCQERLIQEEL